MKNKVILESPLRVDSADFLHLDVPIADLDEVVTSEPELNLTLEYPFEKPYTGTIKAATRREIIEAIRTAFRTMYAATTPEGGPYGRAHQRLDHLYIDRIALDGDVLEIVVTT